jgi:hypothetical protein
MWLLALCVVAGPLAAYGGDKEEKADEKEELTRPKVDKRHIEQARKSKGLREIVSMHDEIAEYYRELATLKAIEDPREARRAERKIDRLESKIDRGKRKLEREVERERKPIEKDYEENKEKYESLKAKAEELEAADKADKATRYHQEAAKYSGPMQSAKRRIDILNWFLFFDAEEDK